MQPHKIVSQSDWIEARKALLADEKRFTRARDELSRRRRELPWVKVEKSYAFEGPDGTETLANLFAGKSQLIVYHFMLGPDWEQGCPSCSYLADHFDGMTVHLAQRDVSFVVISRAPYAQIVAFQKRMGWKFKWVSSHGNDFNFDHHVSFTEAEKASGAVDYNYTRQQFPSEEAPGVSVFAKDGAGAVFHTYSAYSRGLDTLIGTYQFLDLVPKGRDETALPWPMSWIRHHDRYDNGTPNSSTYQQPKTAASCCE
jgi:predicted dithiol-disulfide oxidoreductase (DUF899 family)